MAHYKYAVCWGGGAGGFHGQFGSGEKKGSEVGGGESLFPIEDEHKLLDITKRIRV